MSSSAAEPNVINDRNPLAKQSLHCSSKNRSNLPSLTVPVHTVGQCRSRNVPILSLQQPSVIRARKHASFCDRRHFHPCFTSPISSIATTTRFFPYRNPQSYNILEPDAESPKLSISKIKKTLNLPPTNQPTKPLKKEITGLRSSGSFRSSEFAHVLPPTLKFASWIRYHESNQQQQQKNGFSADTDQCLLVYEIHKIRSIKKEMKTWLLLSERERERAAPTGKVGLALALGVAGTEP
jgi:hypothetical protein